MFPENNDLGVSINNGKMPFHRITVNYVDETGQPKSRTFFVFSPWDTQAIKKVMQRLEESVESIKISSVNVNTLGEFSQRDVLL